jgi:hypothetical protein
MTVSHAGGCLCGAVRYSIAAPVTALRACHCTHCQKNTGSGASVNAVVAGADFAVTQGTPRRFTTKADSGRTLYRAWSHIDPDTEQLPGNPA